MEQRRTRALILLVDDSQTQALVMSNALQAAGFRSRVAHNGVVALEEARKWRPDLIISDVLMPEMDGFALCREVRRDPDLASVPLILNTSTFLDPKDEKFAIAVGATRFALKPADPAVLVDLIRDVLATGHQSPTAVPAEQDDARFLQGYSQRMAATLEEKVAALERQFQETAAARDRLSLLLETSRLAASSLDLDSVLARLAARMVQALNLAFCRIALLNAGGDRLTIAATHPAVSPSAGHVLGRAITLTDAPLLGSTLQQGTARSVHLGDSAAGSGASLSGEERRFLEAGLSLPGVEGSDEHGSSGLLIPMSAGGRSVGLVCVGINGDEPANEEQNQLAQSMAEQVAVTVQNAHLHELEVRSEEHARLLAEMAAVFAGVGSLDDLVRQAMYKATETLAEGCGICVVRPDGNWNVVVGHRLDVPARPGLIEELIRHDLASPDSLLAPAVSQGESVFIADVLHDVVAGGRNLPEWQKTEVRSVAAVPFHDPSGEPGAVVMVDRRPDRFPATHATFLRQYADRLSRAMQEHLLKERVSLLESDLRVAARIQQSLLPTRLPPTPGYDIFGVCNPAREVGGDFFDVMLDAEGCLRITIADVSGKGLPAAIVLAMLRTTLRTLAVHLPPGAVIERLNESLMDDLVSAERFATLIHARLNLASGELCFADAGHGLTLIRLGDRWSSGQSLHPARGLPVGILPSVGYEETCITLGPADLLVAFTDGMTEAMNAASEEFGEARLQAALDELSRTATARDAADLLLTAVSRFTAGFPLSDDQTLLVLRREG